MVADSAEDLGDVVKGPASAIQRTKAWPDVVPHLFSRLCPATTTGALARPLGRGIPSRERLPFLAEVIGIREGGLETLVTDDHVRTWGIGVEDAFRAASFGQAHPSACFEISLQESARCYRIWKVQGDLTAQCEQWLQPGWLDGFRDKVVGAPVAIVPNQTTLFVGGDGDCNCLTRLLDLAAAIYETSSGPMSTALYTTDHTSRVVPLHLPRGHALAHGVELRHRRFAESQYEAQKKGLQDRLGDSLFVAAYMVLERFDGSPVSVATWSDGGPSLLPRVDEIAFVLESERAESEVFRVAWDAVVPRVGALLTRLPDHFPERYLAREWPADFTLDQLRSLAV